MNRFNKNTAHLWSANYLFQFYLFFGVFFPFYPLWLKSFNIGSEEIGIILACGLVTRCLASIGIGALLKKQSHYVPALRIFSILSLLTAVLMCFYNGSFFSLIIVCCLLNIVIAPVFGVTESLVTFLDKRKVIDYGRTRLWGSIGFVSATIICGYVFDIFSISILPFLLAFVGVVFIVTSLINSTKLNTELGYDAKKTEVKSDKVGSPIIPILLFFSVVVLIQGSHAFLFGFSSVYWEHLNIPKTIIGYAWATSVFGEVLVFIFARRLFANMSVVTLLVLASIATVLRWTGLAYAETALSICVIQLLHGGTFAITQVAMIRGVQIFISDSQLSTFQGLIQGVNIAVVASLTYLCGLYYDEYLGGLFLSMALVGIICLLLCACFYLLFGSYKRHNPN